MAATSTPFSLSCISQTRFLSKQRSHSPSPTATSLLLPPQFGHKSYSSHPLRYNGVYAPIVMNPKRTTNVGVTVKASLDNKNVEVLSKEYISVSLAKYVSDLSDKFIKDRGFFTIVLSGESVKHLKKLVEPPYLNSIDWSKWHVFWADEKVVPKTHLDSNYKLAYDRFISKVPIPVPRNVNTIDDALSADGAADVYETAIRLKVKSNVVASSFNVPRFDLILLEMGADGHVASLFPGNPALNETKKWVTFIKDAPQPPKDRITLTLPVINNSSNIAIVVTGAGKADAVNSALKEVDRDEKLPIQLVSPKGDLKWFLDKGAASKLYNNYE